MAVPPWGGEKKKKKASRGEKKNFGNWSQPENIEELGSGAEA